MNDEIGYRTADSFFVDSRYTPIRKDVAEQVAKENNRPITTREWLGGQVNWSGLLEKAL